MKNVLLTGLLLILTVTLICCNQQETLSPQPVFSDIESSDLSIDSPISETDDVRVFSIGEDQTVDDGVDQLYCVYRITSVNKDCPHFKVGDLLCINCPNDGSGCPGKFRKDTKWKFINGDESCEGTWEQALPAGKSCTRCVVGGRRGFEFVD